MEERRSKLREYLEALLIAVVFLQFANTFVVETFYIPSSSMEDTLLVGDHLFVNRFIYGAEGALAGFPLLPSRPLSRGDVVIFRSVEDRTTAVVKRCVGLPGDTVEIIAKQLYLNGQRVDESAYVVHKDAGEKGAPVQRRPLVQRRDNFGPYRVPPGHYFLMGDNRDFSHDSRFWPRPLPAHMVKGRALLIYWSNGGETPDGKGQTVGRWLLHLGKTLVGLPFNTRWGRTFRLIR
jgi:signal peptidase I